MSDSEVSDTMLDDNSEDDPNYELEEVGDGKGKRKRKLEDDDDDDDECVYIIKT